MCNLFAVLTRNHPLTDKYDKGNITYSIDSLTLPFMFTFEIKLAFMYKNLQILVRVCRKFKIGMLNLLYWYASEGANIEKHCQVYSASKEHCGFLLL